MDLYAEIPTYPETYTAGTVLGRLMDGIGFRYRWATEGLTQRDLVFRPAESSRSLRETLDHIHGLIDMIGVAFSGERYSSPESSQALPLEELRRMTLEKIKTLSERFKATPAEQLVDMPIKMRRGERDTDFPFWNAINGPMADILYHLGQVVSHRRAAGNPIDPGVRVFIGKRVNA